VPDQNLNEPSDLRADITAAMNAPDTSVAETSANVAETGTDVPKTGTNVPEMGTPGEKHPTDGRIRDAQGKFAVKVVVPDFSKAVVDPSTGKPVDPAAAKAATDVVTAEANKKAFKAPASWSPIARDALMKADPLVQAEARKREGEIQQAMHSLAGARQFTERMTQALTQYMPTIQASGLDPFQFVAGLAQAATILRSGGVTEKAQLVATIIKQNGVDIETLDGLLVGVKPAANGFDPNAVGQIVQQHMAPVMQWFQTQQNQAQQRMEATNGAAAQEMETFSETAEFFDDVRATMADLTELSARQGHDLTYQEAYDQACLLHPEVKRVILARQKATQAHELTTAAQRAKGAAVSVTGGPGNVSGDAVPENDSLRATIIAAMQNHAR